MTSGDDMEHHFIVYWRRGVAWSPDGERFDRAMRGHIDFMQREHDAGRLLMAGPLLDEDIGIAIFRLDSRRELLERLAEDTAVAEGHLEPEIHAWMPWNFEEGIEVTDIVMEGD